MRVLFSLVILACAATAGCSEFPGQGFVTSSLGGTVMDAVPGTAPTGRSEVYSVPEPVAGEDFVRPDQCVEAARARADDTKAQGFDESVQKQVYDAAFTDCRKWAGPP
jgi:hypothetical protein